jgi:hypothetical protein
MTIVHPFPQKVLGAKDHHRSLKDREQVQPTWTMGKQSMVGPHDDLVGGTGEGAI